VFGEGADRVQEFAAKAGAQSYSTFVQGGSLVRMAANRAWINDVMDQGSIIIDIGRSPAATGPLGRYYQPELEEIAARGYAHVIRWSATQ